VTAPSDEISAPVAALLCASLGLVPLHPDTFDAW